MLRIPIELRILICEYAFGGETLQIDFAGRVLLPYPNYMSLRQVCRQMVVEIKSERLIRWNTFRVDDPIVLRRWLRRLTPRERAAVHSLKIHHGIPWNSRCGSKSCGYSLTSNPVGRSPPWWFTRSHSSLTRELSGLKFIQLCVTFEKGYFVGFLIPGRREFILEAVDGAVEHWRAELETWNPGVAVCTRSNLP